MDTKGNGLDLLAPADVLPHVAGARFAALMQRFWRARRTVNPGVLVLAMLRDEGRCRLLDPSLASGEITTEYFAAQADALLGFIAAQLPDDSCERAVCRLEQLMLRANDCAHAFKSPASASFGPQCWVRRGRHAGLVLLREAPPVVLTAFLPPSCSPAGGVTGLLVAPGSVPLCRVASREERELWLMLDSSAVATNLRQQGVPRQVIMTMLQIGALEYV
jgi:hypothetical protein